MADGTFTQADIDAAVTKATEKHDEDVSGLKKKVEDLIAANKTLKRGAEIKPEDLQAAEDRADKLATDLAEANKQLKAVTGERDKAVKSLETEQGAARSYALEAEIAGAIAEGNVVPALVPAFKAMVSAQAKADLVDGKYAVTIGEKAAREHIKAFLDSDDGKHFRAAANNNGGGSPGGKSGEPGKTMSRADYDKGIASDPVATRAFLKDGGKIVDAA